MYSKKFAFWKLSTALSLFSSHHDDYYIWSDVGNYFCEPFSGRSCARNGFNVVQAKCFEVLEYPSLAEASQS